MNIDKAREAACLLEELDSLENIERVLKKEKDHWWRLLTPDTINKDNPNRSGIELSDTLCETFKCAVEGAIMKIQNKIRKL